MKPGTVALAYVHDREVTHSFHDSLAGLFLYDLANDQHLFGGAGPLKMRCGTGGIVGARNKVAERFVTDGNEEWLFWIDTDMGFEPDTIDRLLAVADPVNRPIVGGLCFVQREVDLDGYSGFVTQPGNTIMDWTKNSFGEGFVPRIWYEPNALTRCDGTGSACVLIHRSVLEKVKKEYGPVWYDQARGPDGGQVAEDLSFCMRAAAVGFPVYVHTGVRTTHMKTVWLGENHFWKAMVAPPATIDTAVLVPVLKRPQNAKPFMESLRASTGVATAYAIYDDADTATMAAWEAAGAFLIPSTGTTFATKINNGYNATREPWMFVVGDDVRFHPGWLDHAQFAAAITEADVIGTNDLGNPRVLRGEHATHMLIRRSYVDEIGASWDGPGIVCHEGYKHWYVDDELVTAAKERGVWSMALGSRVEHLHPIFNKGTNDETYRIGQLYADRDRKVFEKRSKSHELVGA